MRMAMRVVAAVALVGIGSQAFMAQAGWRHFRMFRSNCAGSACSAPMYVAAPPASFSCGGPSWGCSGPACAAPMWGCSGPTCSYPMSYQAGYAPTSYGGLPMTAYGSGSGQSGYGTYYDFSTAGTGSYAAGGYGGYGANGYGTGGMYGTPVSYPQAAAYGGQGYGGPGYGAAFNSGMPSYYAPVPSQYTPVPPAPASDLVW